MRFGDYCRDRLLTFVLNLFCMLFLSLYLKVIGVHNGELLLILIAWFFVLVFYFGQDYMRKNQYFKQIEETMESMDQKYLIGEVMGRGRTLEDRIYRQLILTSNKSVIEAIRSLEDEKREYQDYIEGWVHEVKLPLTSMELMCQNHRNDMTREMERNLSEIDHIVEMALYYTRSNAVYKDYLIQNISLSQVVTETISKNKQFLIQNSMTIDVNIEDDEVYSDSKWISFIVNQIMMNAVKYRKDGHGLLRIYTKKEAGGIRLYLEDDGIGISDAEITRVFEKGFTGTNGRNHAKSTGMGLYLCNILCTKLGLGLDIESKEQAFTRLIISFPISTYLTTL